ncbi:unnamed protein product, partial [Prorocentrum cordatum]
AERSWEPAHERPPAGAAGAEGEGAGEPEEWAEPWEPVHPAADVPAAAEEDVMLAEFHASAEGTDGEGEYVLEIPADDDVYMEPEPELDAGLDGQPLDEAGDELDGPGVDARPHGDDVDVSGYLDVAVQDEPEGDCAGQLWL